MMLHVIIKLLVLWSMYENSYPCSEECVVCRSGSRCQDCISGYYLHSQKCLICYEGCSICEQSHFNCSSCKPGRWGGWCQYSCIPCNDCIDKRCTDYCKDVDPSLCNNQCPDICTVLFTGLRKNQTVSATLTPDGLIRSTSKPTRQQSTRTTPTTTTTITTKTKSKRTTAKHTETHLTTTQPKTTSFMRHVTTKPQSDGTVHSEQPGDKTRAIGGGTTGQADSQTDDSRAPVLYIVVAVVGVLVLAVVIVVIACIKRSYRTNRQDQLTCPHDANNKESRQLTENAGIYSNVCTHDNAIRNVETTNVAESNTGSVDMNATVYENVVDKTAMSASDTVNTYEAFNQYNNIREAENKYTSLIGNENVYYNVLD